MSPADDELRTVHETVIALATNTELRRAWRDDPTSFAASCVPEGAARRLIAGFDAADLEHLAGNMAAKRHDDDERRRRRSARRAAPRRDPNLAPRVRPLAPAPRRRPAVGCGMRAPLVAALFGHLQLVEIWEHNADWYLGEDAGRDGAHRLARYASTAPVALHSLGLSVGSHACLDDHARIEGLRRLARAVSVPHLSDHLAFTRAGGRELPHFVPLWRVPEQLELVVANVTELQERLGLRLVLENPAMILDPEGDLTTAAFLNELTQRTGCGVLLDLENLRVDHENGRVDERALLAELDLSSVVAVHLAGGTAATATEPAIDSHSWPVSPDRFTLLDELLPLMPNCEHIVIERDDRFEQGDEVVADLERLHTAVRPFRAASLVP